MSTDLGVRRQLSRASASRQSAARASYGSNQDENVSRTSKSIYSFVDKRLTYQIQLHGSNVTPQNLPDTQHLLVDEIFAHKAFENKARAKSDAHFSAPAKSASENVGIKLYATTLNLDDIRIDYTLNTEAGQSAEDAPLDMAPSAFYLPIAKPVTTYPPEITVVLKEMDTVFLFSLPSFSCDKGTLEGNDVEQENEHYMYMTVGKGRNRKTITTETQTKDCIVQSRHTMAKKPQKKNASSFASVWDMYDTYALENLPKEIVEVDEMVMHQSAAPNLLRKKPKKTADATSTAGQVSAVEIMKTVRFQDALVLTERVLASNIFIVQQKQYRGLTPFDPLALDLKYFYSVKVLWTFSCEEVAGMPVMFTCFNPANLDLIATAYGKFLYADVSSGVICIWCSKNPRKPERLYRFDEPATALEFSTKNPNWLACGFDNGDVLILDITSYDKKIIAKSNRETNPCFEPIWAVTWGVAVGSQEYVMTTCQDGRINRYTSTKTHEFICTPMMRVTQVEGNVRGVSGMASSTEFEVPIVRHPAALCYARHPSLEHVYFVGTDEGCVHKCSTNYLNQHMEVFRAHIGPVYDIQFSPFWRNLMVTCGADWAIRLWIDGIEEPIVTMSCSSSVYGVTWSPNNSTILVTVSGNLLCIWDIRRKSYVPSSEYKFPSSTVLTYVKFNASGESLIVGDTEGQVHTFHLEDMPIAPFYQKQILEESIGKVVSTRPHIVRQLEKLQRFNATQAT